MLSLRRPAQRFSLCLLDEGEDFVALWVGVCVWPKSISGNWQNMDKLPGNIMVCSKSIFFEPDDVRIPIVRSISPLRAALSRKYSEVQTDPLLVPIC